MKSSVITAHQVQLILNIIISIMKFRKRKEKREKHSGKISTRFSIIVSLCVCVLCLCSASGIPFTVYRNQYIYIYFYGFFFFSFTMISIFSSLVAAAAAFTLYSVAHGRFQRAPHTFLWHFHFLLYSIHRQTAKCWHLCVLSNRTPIFNSIRTNQELNSLTGNNYHFKIYFNALHQFFRLIKYNQRF